MPESNEKPSARPIFRKLSWVIIVACVVVAILTVALALHFREPPLTVERIEDAEWAFKTLLGDTNFIQPAWLFRYRGGLVDCWLEERSTNGLNITQTVPISQDVRKYTEISGPLRYGLILVRATLVDGRQAVELSHVAFFRGHSTLPSQKTLVIIPGSEGESSFAAGGFFPSAHAKGLLTWTFWEPDPDHRVNRFVTLMCGRPKVAAVQTPGAPAEPSAGMNKSRQPSL